MMRVPLLRGRLERRPLRRLARPVSGHGGARPGASRPPSGPRPCATKQKAVFCPIATQLQGGCGPGKIGAFCIIAWGDGGFAAIGGGPGPGEGPGCHRNEGPDIDCSRCYTLTSFYKPNEVYAFRRRVRRGSNIRSIYLSIFEEIQSGKLVENQGFADLSA